MATAAELETAFKKYNMEGLVSSLAKHEVEIDNDFWQHLLQDVDTEEKGMIEYE